ncbi:hypothetical protein [Streptomyces sp. NPDC002490]
MHRWSPLNERQLALLGRLANGKESEKPWDPASSAPPTRCATEDW